MRHALRRLTAKPALVALVVLLGLTMAGCSSSSSEANSPSGQSDGSTSPSGTDSVSRDDLSDELPLRWTKEEIVDDNHIRVHFTGKSPTCFGVRSDVSETDETVTIALYEGKLPGAPEQCTLEGVLGSIFIETSQPVGDREVVRG